MIDRRSTRLRLLASNALRLAAAVPLAWGVATAIAHPQLTLLPSLAALAIAALTLWNPALGLVLLAGLAPAGRLFQAAPVRVAELFAWSFLAAWLLAVWRPLLPPQPRLPRTVPLLFMATVAVSWLALAIRAAGGVPDAQLPAFVAGSIPADFLVWGIEQPETWNMLLAVAGVAAFLAAAAITAGNRELPRALAISITASAAFLAAATLLDIGRQWRLESYGGWFLLRYLQGERFSLHMPDLNAAGSLYAMAAVAAAIGAFSDRARRWLWIAALALIAPAALIAGSRTAGVAFAAALLVAVALTGWRPGRRQTLTAIAVAAVLALGAVAVADWRTDVRGAVGRSLSLRSQFTSSTMRMIGTAPVTGVGIGQYYPRSNEFFTPELRDTYGYENAHNYFLQQFAELGIVGGLLFLGLVGLPVAAAWRMLRTGPRDPGLVALFAATVAYLLTCITGHPLLVPEAVFPFWIALGGLAGAAAPAAPSYSTSRIAAGVAVVAAVLVMSVAVSYRTYAAATTPPPGFGFHEEERDENGEAFRWMTRRAVAFVEPGSGFLQLRVKAPPRRAANAQPFVLETLVSGEIVDRRELPFGEWTTYQIGLRDEVEAPFRRVDLRLNQVAWQPVEQGRRTVERPVGVMIGELRRLDLN